MRAKIGRVLWWRMLATALALTALPSCNGMGSINFELTGTVRDFQTKQPIEGAYAMAVYQGFSSTLGSGTASWCRKTLGMYTGKDGTFHFPVEKLDNISPVEVVAIKPGYRLHYAVFHSGEVQKHQGKENYIGRDVFLKVHDPEEKNWTLGGRQCDRPESRQAVEANIQYLKIQLDEYIKFGEREQIIRGTREIIKRLEDTPDVNVRSPN